MRAEDGELHPAPEHASRILDALSSIHIAFTEGPAHRWPGLLGVWNGTIMEPELVAGGASESSK
jgi:hypothetical protein